MPARLSLVTVETENGESHIRNALTISEHTHPLELPPREVEQAFLAISARLMKALMILEPPPPDPDFFSRSVPQADGAAEINTSHSLEPQPPRCA